MTKAMMNKDGEILEQAVWRLVGPEFETWDARGEVSWCKVKTYMYYSFLI
jgi:hypothetical protein